jgi:phage FluMu gp28-like protein
MTRLLPAHARDFKGKARNIPAEECFMLPYQKRWIEDRSLLRVMEKSRRVGISYSTAYDLVRQHAVRDHRVDTWVSSRDDATAREFLRDCTAFSDLLKAASEKLGWRVMDEREGGAYVLRFANHTHINSLSSNPNVFAGKGGNVVLDEFALRNEPRAVWSIAQNTIDWGGRLSVISTHRGSQNYFAKLVYEYKYEGNPKGISLHTVTLQDALDQGFLWKLQLKLPEGDPRLEMDEAAYFDFQRSRQSDEESFLQEMMCVPADDESAFLPYEMIDGCTYLAGESWEQTLAELSRCQNDLFLGVDVGRSNDLTVMWLLERTGGVCLTRRLVTLQKTPFTEQEAYLHDLLMLPRLRRCCIDATGLGMQFTERAMERYGSYRVEGVRFTGPVKEALAFPLRKAFEDRALRIPRSDAITADLRKVRKTTTSAGNIRFTAESDASGHSDRFWALALAVHAAAPATRFEPTWFEPDPDQGGRVTRRINTTLIG